jgi:hypothetical protein
VFADSTDTCEEFTVIGGLKAQKAVSQERLAMKRCGPGREIGRAWAGHLDGNPERMVRGKQEMRLGGLQRRCRRAEKSPKENTIEWFEQPALY